ncbi:transposase IS4 family protein [Actinobacteria bacterium OV320]|nr:transposase IS4 family protein [Actinobacteria bacterium OV320]
MLLVAAYWRTNLTVRQLGPLFGVSKSAAARIIDHLGPRLALQPRKRFAKDTVLIVDGTLVPTRDHSVAEQSKNYRYSTNHQVVIDADTRLVVVVGQPLPGNRNDCRAWTESGVKDAVGKTLTIADGGYPGTGLLMPHRRANGQTELPAWKNEHNRSHKQVRARVAEQRRAHGAGQMTGLRAQRLEKLSMVWSPAGRRAAQPDQRLSQVRPEQCEAGRTAERHPHGFGRLPHGERDSRPVDLHSEKVMSLMAPLQTKEGRVGSVGSHPEFQAISAP